MMMRRFLRQRLNALSIMDRLIRWGIPRTRARAIGCWWERRVDPLLYDSPCGIGKGSLQLLEVQNGSHDRSGAP
jgi:hypothetical protein